jgi:ACS family sodium-dependent inorganic phosphate cotransporter-like MFS transporter 5
MNKFPSSTSLDSTDSVESQLPDPPPLVINTKLLIPNDDDVFPLSINNTSNNHNHYEKLSTCDSIDITPPEEDNNNLIDDTNLILIEEQTSPQLTTTPPTKMHSSTATTTTTITSTNSLTETPLHSEKLQTVLMCALAAALSYCDRVNLSVSIISMGMELGWNDSDKSLILGSFYWGYLSSQIIGSTLVHKRGGKTVLGIAGLCWSVCTILVPIIARSGGIIPIILLRIALGISEGVTFPVIAYLLRSVVPEHERSRGVAAISVGTLSGAVFSFSISPVIVMSLHWDSVFYFFGGICGPIWLLLWIACVPDDHIPTTTSTTISDHHHSSSSSNEFLVMLRSPPIQAIIFSHFIHNLTHFSLMSWLPSFTHDKLHFVGASLSISALPWVVTGTSVIVASMAADRILTKRSIPSPTLRRYCTVGGFTIAGFCMMMVAILCDSYPISSLLFLSLALAANGAAPIAGYEAAKLDITHSPAEAARLQSLSNTIATLAGIFGVPMVAQLKHSSSTSSLSGEDNWKNVFIVLGGCFWIVSVFAWWKLKWSVGGR